MLEIIARLATNVLRQWHTLCSINGTFGHFVSCTVVRPNAAPFVNSRDGLPPTVGGLLSFIRLQFELDQFSVSAKVAAETGGATSGDAPKAGGAPARDASAPGILFRLTSGRCGHEYRCACRWRVTKSA
jgi:hypothetical protein